MGKQIKEITLDIVYSVVYFVQFNLRYMASLLEIAVPYAMYIMGQQLAIGRGKFVVGGEIFIPVLCTMVVYYLREIANRSNKGSRIPIPNKRFTEVDEDGEVQVEEARLQEMILYMADLEDWMERKRWL